VLQGLARRRKCPIHLEVVGPSFDCYLAVVADVREFWNPMRRCHCRLAFSSLPRKHHDYHTQGSWHQIARLVYGFRHHRRFGYRRKD
jgi:hypothetical protein